MIPLGLLVGLMVLSRTDTVLILAPAALFLVLSPPGRLRHRLMRSLWIAAVAALLIGPYAFWNYVEHGYATPISGVVKQWSMAHYLPRWSDGVHAGQWLGLAHAIKAMSFPVVLAPLRHPHQLIAPLAVIVLLVGLLGLRRRLWAPTVQGLSGRGLLVCAVVAGVALHTAYLLFGYRACGVWNFQYFFPLVVIATIIVAITTARIAGDLARGFWRILGKKKDMPRQALAVGGVLLAMVVAVFLIHENNKAMAKRYADISSSLAGGFRAMRYPLAKRLAADYPPTRSSVLGGREYLAILVTNGSSILTVWPIADAFFVSSSNVTGLISIF